MVLAADPLIKTPSISTWQNEKFTSSLSIPIQRLYLCHLLASSFVSPEGSVHRWWMRFDSVKHESGKPSHFRMAPNMSATWDSCLPVVLLSLCATRTTRLRKSSYCFRVLTLIQPRREQLFPRQYVAQPFAFFFFYSTAPNLSTPSGVEAGFAVDP